MTNTASSSEVAKRSHIPTHLEQQAREAAFTPEWLKQNLVRGGKYDPPHLISISYHEAQALHDRITEIDLLCLEDPQLFHIANHIRHQFYQGLSWSYWYGFIDQAPSDVIEQYSVMTLNILEDIWRVDQEHLDAWTVFLYECKHTMPPWARNDQSQGLPFGEGKSANVLSSLVSDAIVSWRDGRLKVAAGGMYYALCVAMTPLARQHSYMLRHSVYNDRNLSEQLRDLFRHRYFVDCLKSKTTPSRADLARIDAGELTYDYSTPAALFFW